MDNKLNKYVRWSITALGIVMFVIGIHLIGIRPPASTIISILAGALVGYVGRDVGWL